MLTLAYVGGGLVLLALGFLLIFTPGPGSVLLIAGAALLATYSRYAARLLDRLELGVRAALARVRRGL